MCPSLHQYIVPMMKLRVPKKALLSNSIERGSPNPNVGNYYLNISYISWLSPIKRKLNPIK